MLYENANYWTTSVPFVFVAVAALSYSSCVVQSTTLSRVMFPLDSLYQQGEQRHNENKISDDQIGSTSSCIANISQLTMGLLRSQALLETRTVRFSESLHNDSENRGFSSSATTILKDVERTLMRKMTPALESGSYGNSMLYRMPDALTHTDVMSMYSINLLRNISAMVADMSSVAVHAKRRFEYENNYCENARNRAASITSVTNSPWVKAVKEMQAWSQFVSPALRGFDISSSFAGCQDAFIKGARESGVYTIARDNLDPFRAWCDFDYFGGWMVFQRRFDGTVNFFRNWNEYQKGFGNLWGEHWLGLDTLHQLTRNAVVLSIYMEAFDETQAWANYSSFRVGEASLNYRLTISGYSGTAGDSLSYHNGYAFSTRDRDNDGSGGNCAREFFGAWWYAGCYQSNLNGLYERGSAGTEFNVWYTFKSNNQALKTTIMRMFV